MGTSDQSEVARLARRLEREHRARREAEAIAEKTVRELYDTVRNLERSNAELEQFAYVASHDLQEPLRMVASYTELLARRYGARLDPDGERFIAYAVDGARRMQQLVNDLLVYSRIEKAGHAFEPCPCDDVLEHVLANLRLALAESRAEVTHAPLPTVMGDRAQLGQLFQNIVGNALKFHSEAPPCVDVAATRNGPDWRFSVRDNGIGFEPEYAERIFRMFQRLHERGRYPGTGMGLAIAKRIVERHGGRIWADSTPGIGSTFFFTLPAAPA
jgi:light-regulated signal transduction histidine kinase (bacteriophytochrome)